MSKGSLAIGTKAWEDRINAAWQSSVEGIFQTGHLLIASAKEAGKTAFKDMIGSGRLRFSKRTAERLMVIAANEVLATHVSQLPPHWGTLYELARLDAGTLRLALESGRIDPEMERADAVQLLPPPAPKAAKPPREVASQIIEADYTELPPATPYQAEEAVSVRGNNPDLGRATADGGPVTDDREGGEAVVTHPLPAAERAVERDVAPDRGRTGAIPPREGMVAVWVDPKDHVGKFWTGLLLALGGAAEAGEDAIVASVRSRSDTAFDEYDLGRFANLIDDFNAARRGEEAA